MSADLPPIPPELAALIGDERSAPAGSDDERTRIGARVAGTVGLVSSLGSGGAAAGTTTATATATTTGALLGVAGKVVAVVIALGAVVSGVTYVATRGHAPPSPAPVTSPSPAVAPPREGSVPLPTVPEAEVVPAPPAPPPTPSSVPAKHSSALPSAPIAVESESALLARAWSARAGGDAQLVLALVERDAALHPDGQLVEERDALRIDALARLGHRDEARAAAHEFLVRCPHSLQRALVAHVLEESP